MLYYTQPHKDYCLAIGLFLKYLRDNYSNKVIRQISKKFEEHTLLKLSTNYRQQVEQGYKLSSLLIDTPTHLTYEFYKIESGVVPHLKIIKAPKVNNPTISFKVSDEVFTLPIDLVDYDTSNWLYIYCYWLRKGYSVIEVDYMYIVTEPLGVNYSIDSLGCNCPNGINKLPCLHIQLCKWYKMSQRLLLEKEKLVNKIC